MSFFKKFFGSSKAPAPPQIQTQPAQYDVMDFQDLITGTETVTVTDASGKKKRITRRLPRSAEEQQIYDNATKLFNDSLKNIEALSVIDPSQAAEFAPYLKAYKGNLDRSLTDAVNRTRASLETNLVKAGLQDSTAATELRTALARDEMQQRGNLDEQVRLQGEQMRDKQLARQYGLLELGANQRGQDLNTAMAGQTAGLMQQEYALDNQRFTNNMNAQLNNYKMQLARFNTPNKIGFGQELLRAAARGAVNMIGGSMMPGSTPAIGSPGGAPIEYRR